MVTGAIGQVGVVVVWVVEMEFTNEQENVTTQHLSVVENLVKEMQ